MNHTQWLTPLLMSLRKRAETEAANAWSCSAEPSSGSGPPASVIQYCLPWRSTRSANSGVAAML